MTTPADCPILSDPNTPQLTSEEVRELRELLESARHTSWLGKKILVGVPVVVACVAGIWQAISWVFAHITFKP